MPLLWLREDLQLLSALTRDVQGLSSASAQRQQREARGMPAVAWPPPSVGKHTFKLHSSSLFMAGSRIHRLRPSSFVWFIIQLLPLRSRRWGIETDSSSRYLQISITMEVLWARKWPPREQPVAAEPLHGAADELTEVTAPQERCG